MQVPRPYSVSGADGRERYSGVGKCQGSGGNNSAAVAIRKALRADGCRSPRAPLFLPPGFAGSAGQMGDGKTYAVCFFSALRSLRWHRRAVFQRLRRSLPEADNVVQRSGCPSFAKDSLLSKLWGPRPAFRRSRRRPQAGGIHFRRKAQRASCKSRVRTACPGLTGVRVTPASENVTPAWLPLARTGRLRKAAERAWPAPVPTDGKCSDCRI